MHAMTPKVAVRSGRFDPRSSGKPTRNGHELPDLARGEESA